MKPINFSPTPFFLLTCHLAIMEKGDREGFPRIPVPRANWIPKIFMGLVAGWPIAVIWLKTENKTQGF
jgi:hypothetical protein